MSKQVELNLLKNSCSYDTPIKSHSRSGDSNSESNSRLDFYASTQSAEADIIEAEERAELRAGKKKFAQLLGLYFKKIFTATEFKFFTESVRSNNRTPREIGREMGVNFEKYINAITAKYTENLPRLAMVMRACGCTLPRGVYEFMPQWSQYLKHCKKERIRALRYYYDHYDKIRAQQNANARKRWAADPEKAREKKRRQRAAHREEYNAKQRQYAAEHREICRERVRRYRAEHGDRIKKHYAEHREEINARRREQFSKLSESEREAKRERLRQYYAAHREQFREYKRQKRLKQKAVAV